MQYIAKTHGVPLKVEDQEVSNPISISKEGHIEIVEKRKITLTKEELLKSITALKDREGYLEFQLSEKNLEKIRSELKDISTKRKMFEDVLDKKARGE